MVWRSSKEAYDHAAGYDDMWNGLCLCLNIITLTTSYIYEYSSNIMLSFNVPTTYFVDNDLGPLFLVRKL